MRWIYDLNPQAYALRLALLFAFCNRNDDKADAVLDYFDIHESEVLRDVYIMLAFFTFLIIFGFSVAHGTLTTRLRRL